MARKLTKVLSFLLCFLLIFEQSGFAQVAGQLDISGHILSLRNSLIQDKFRPLHLRYLSYDNINNNFKLLLDKGTAPKEQDLEGATKTLLNYFFVGITLPNDSFWVNLRPDSPDNIIDPALAATDVGRILLEADLQLKKDTAKFTSPQTPEGKKYWGKLYQKADELFGTSNITIPTLTRPWIVPGEIIIREAEDNAYIYKATLKVCLEQDYLKDSATYNFKDERLKQLNEYSSQLIRELIIPKLTKEINNAQRYASLRQVYYSLILAQWFKQRFYGKGGLYSWLIDKKNLNGLTSKEHWSKTTYFKEYQKSFKDGEYNIQEPINSISGKTIRSYFSGGIAFGGLGGQGIFDAIKRGVISGKRNILELLKKKEQIKIEIKGGDLNGPGEINITKKDIPPEDLSGEIGKAEKPEESVIPSTLTNEKIKSVILDKYPDAQQAHIDLVTNQTQASNITTEAEALSLYKKIRAQGGFISIGFGGKIQKFIQSFSKKSRLHKQLIKALRNNKEYEIRRVLEEIFNERHSGYSRLTDNVLDIYKYRSLGLIRAVEAGLDLTEAVKKDRFGSDVGQLQELAEAFEISSQDKGNQLFQIRNDERKYHYKLLEIRLEKEYGDIGIQLAQFAKEVNWHEYDVRDAVSLAKSNKIDISTILGWFESVRSKAQSIKDLQSDLSFSYKTARLLLEHNVYDHEIIFTAAKVIEVENSDFPEEIKHPLQSLDENQRLRLVLVLTGVSSLDSELATKLFSMVLEWKQQQFAKRNSYAGQVDYRIRIIVEIEKALLEKVDLVKPEKLLKSLEDYTEKYNTLNGYERGSNASEGIRSAIEFILDMVAQIDEVTLNMLRSHKIDSEIKQRLISRYLYFRQKWDRNVLEAIESQPEIISNFIYYLAEGDHQRVLDNLDTILRVFNFTNALSPYSKKVKSIISSNHTQQSFSFIQPIVDGTLNNLYKESEGDKDKFTVKVLKNDSVNLFVREKLVAAYLSYGIEWDKGVLEIIGSQPPLLKKFRNYLVENPQKIQQLINNETILKRVLLMMLPQLEKGLYFGQEKLDVEILSSKFKKERRFRIPGYFNEYVTLLRIYLQQQEGAFKSDNYRVDQRQTMGWSYEKTATESIDNLLSKNRSDRNFSGHLAMHQTKNWELMMAILAAGYIIPADIFETLNKTNIFQQMLKEGKVNSLIATEFVHFSIDKRVGYLSTPYAFVYPLEMLLENQAFMLDPLSVDDWAIGGFSANPEHESHKIPIRQAIILVPKSEQEKMEGLFKKLEQEYTGWQRPMRIFYYEGRFAEEGLEQLQEKYNLKLPKQITISNLARPIRKLQGGKFKCDVVGGAAISLLSIKDVTDINGIIKYHELPYLSRLTEVQDFSAQLEGLAADILSGMVIGEAEVEDTGSSKRGTYQERYSGFPDDFDLMVNVSGFLPDDTQLKEFANNFVDKLQEKKWLEAIYGAGEFTISPEPFVSQRDGRKLVKIKIFREHEKNIPTLSIDINFFSNSQGADGIRYQAKFWKNLDRLLSGLNDKDKEEGRQYILSTIRSLKSIFKNNGVYSWAEGGLRGVGTEQLTLQLNEVEDEFGTPKPVYSLDELKKTFNISRALQVLEDAMFNGEQFAGLEGFRNNLPLWDPGSLSPRRLTDRVHEMALIRLIDVANEGKLSFGQSTPSLATNLGVQVANVRSLNEGVPPGMGGTGFLPHIFNNIVERLNGGQPLILTTAESEVLLWGLLNPDPNIQTQIMQILNKLSEEQKKELQDMASRWAHPGHRMAERLQFVLAQAKQNSPFIREVVDWSNYRGRFWNLSLSPDMLYDMAKSDEEKVEIDGLIKNIPKAIDEFRKTIEDKYPRGNALYRGMVLTLDELSYLVNNGIDISKARSDNIDFTLDPFIAMEYAFYPEGRPSQDEDILIVVAVFKKEEILGVRDLDSQLRKPTLPNIRIKISKEQPIGPPLEVWLYNRKTHHFEDITEKIRIEKGAIGNSVFGDPLSADNIRDVEQKAPKSENINPGGIDFRAFPIVTQPMPPALAPLPSGAQVRPLVNQIEPALGDLDKEWQEIQNMLSAGMVPSSQRIKDYLHACYQKKDFSQDIDKVLSCIADILRLEEERVSQTEPVIKELLVLLESDEPANELQLALSKITVLPSEPKLVGF